MTSRAEELLANAAEAMDRRALRDHLLEPCCRGTLRVDCRGSAWTAICRSLPGQGARLAKQRADVVLCDLGLPGMSGFDVAQAIRRDLTLREIQLVALPGYGQPEDRRRTEDAGFDAHLVKPVDIGTLNEALCHS